jgi:uncharacterized membrane protein YqjE
MPIMLAEAIERLRQERETFEQRKRQEERWFVLRLVMGYSAVVLLASIMGVSSFILLNAKDFASTPNVATGAGAALFADVLGLLGGIWKIALNPSFLTKLAPITGSHLAEGKEEHPGEK